MAATDTEVEEIRSDGSTQPLERIFNPQQQQEKDRENFFYSTLILQAGLFFLFQLRSILLTLEPSTTSEAKSILAKQSELALLAPATATVAYGIWVGSQKVANASSRKELQNAIGELAVEVVKGVTVGAFDINAIYEEIEVADPTIARVAAWLFVAFIAFEILVHGITSAFLPITNYLCITLFVDCFLKAWIEAGAVMQLFPETALYGFFIAMAGFAGVMLNVYTAKQHLNKENVAELSEETPLNVQRTPLQPFSDEETFGLNTSSQPLNINGSDSVSTDTPPVDSSSYWASFWHRMQEVPAYFGIHSSRPGNSN